MLGVRNKVPYFAPPEHTLLPKAHARLEHRVLANQVDEPLGQLSIDGWVSSMETAAAAER